MNQVGESSSLFGVGRVFALLSIQHRLNHEQRLEFKLAGRPCPIVPLKGRSSNSVYETFPWICGDAEKNSYYCWPCLIMGDHSKVDLKYFSFKPIAIAIELTCSSTVY